MKKSLPLGLILAFSISISLLSSCSGDEKSAEERAVTPPAMGWSSWNAFMVHISDSLICTQADLMVDLGLLDAGFNEVHVDDGYFDQRDPHGNMVPNKTRFPGGMKAVADHIHSLGMKAGLYSDAGINTCGSMWNNDVAGVGAGLFGHEVQDADLYFNKWGYDYIKIDFCGGQQQGLDEGQRYLRIREVIDSVAGRPIEINICRWDYPGTWTVKAGNSWRISEDIRPYWQSIRNIVEKNLYLSAYAYDGHYNDMDMLVVGYQNNPTNYWQPFYGLTQTEETSHFGLWCIMSSPLMLGCDLRGMPSATLHLVTNPELIALNQDPLGKQAYVAVHEGETYVLVKDLLKSHGPVRAAAFYNPSDSAARMTAELSSLGFEGEVSVRDLVAREDLGKVCDHLVFDLEPHQTRFLRLEGERCDACLYEAEWGFVPTFSKITSELVGHAETCPGASGGVAIVGLGGREENCLIWNDVYVSNAGEYELSVKFVDQALDAAPATEKPEFSIEVNGDEVFNESTFTAYLNKGSNTIRIFSEQRLPAVDCLVVE